ncbi:MAG: hypothetical protein H6670_02625 [Anaerolineaceae bacterium]|nr:hypothetical protein [Anaerolineae bacterium]MCB9458517.1 hypothetical protein [Anaerolineaceae bacterium]
MVAHDVFWHTPDVILCIRLTGHLDVGEANVLNDEMQSILDSCDGPIALVIDAEEMDLSADFAGIRSQMTYTDHPLIDRLIVFTTHRLTRTWMQLIHKQKQDVTRICTSQYELGQQIHQYLKR